MIGGDGGGDSGGERERGRWGKRRPSRPPGPRSVASGCWAGDSIWEADGLPRLVPVGWPGAAGDIGRRPWATGEGVGEMRSWQANAFVASCLPRAPLSPWVHPPVRSLRSLPRSRSIPSLQPSSPLRPRRPRDGHPGLTSNSLPDCGLVPDLGAAGQVSASRPEPSGRPTPRAGDWHSPRPIRWGIWRQAITPPDGDLAGRCRSQASGIRPAHLRDLVKELLTSYGQMRHRISQTFPQIPEWWRWSGS